MICVVCLKPSTFRCKICATLYCSIICQRKDWNIAHKFTCCSPGDFRLSHILKGILKKEQQLKNKDKGFTNTMIFTSACLDFFEDKRLLSFYPFATDGKQYNFANNICCVCGNKVDYKGPLRDVQKTIYIGEELREVDYWTCIACNIANKEICAVSLMETGKCGFYARQRFLIFMLCIQDYVPKDIIKYIFDLYRQNKCACWK